MAASGTSREPGLVLAIAGAGGISALARRLNLAQPSVSRWRRVPAERLIAIEAATGVPRELLRPDLYRRSAPPCAAEPRREANHHPAFDRPEA